MKPEVSILVEIKSFCDNISGVLEAVGFILGFLTFIGVVLNKKEIKKLNKKNFFINRMPENLKDLKSASSKIVSLSSNIEENKDKILVEISILSPILKSLKKSLQKEDLEHFILLNNEIRKHKFTYLSIDNVVWFRRVVGYYNLLDDNYVRNVYRYLTILITDIENINKDFKKDLGR